MFPKQSMGGGGGMPFSPVGSPMSMNMGAERPQRRVSERGGMTNPMLPSYKRGGKVKKTGPAKLHKGERVLTKRQAKSRKMKER